MDSAEAKDASICQHCGIELKPDEQGERLCAACRQQQERAADADALGPMDTHPTGATALDDGEGTDDETSATEAARLDFPTLPKDWRPQFGETSTLDDVTRELRQIRARLPERPDNWQSLGSLTAAEQMLVGFKIGLGAMLAVMLASAILLGCAFVLSALGVIDWGQTLAALAEAVR